VTALYSFDAITEAKDRLFPRKYTYTKYTPPGTGLTESENGGACPVSALPAPVEPVVVEMGPPTYPLASDADMDEIKCHVSYIQSSAHRFKRYRDDASLEILLNATDTLSAYLMDLVGNSGTSEPGTGAA
jgi:hypothetical protein